MYHILGMFFAIIIMAAAFDIAIKGFTGKAFLLPLMGSLMRGVGTSLINGIGGLISGGIRGFFRGLFGGRRRRQQREQRNNQDREIRIVIDDRRPRNDN